MTPDIAAVIEALLDHRWDYPADPKSAHRTHGHLMPACPICVGDLTRVIPLAIQLYELRPWGGHIQTTDVFGTISDTAEPLLPGVTVVIPTIPGREDLLMRAGNSVAVQTYRPEEVFVQVDDDRRGAAATRNEALQRVITEWVAWLDDDDELLPNHLEVCMDVAERGDVDLVYPGMIAVGGRDPLACPVNGILVNPYGVPFGPEQAHHLRTVGNFIPITWVGRTSLIRAVGGFPQPVPDPTKGSGRIEEDYGLLLKLLDAGARFAHVPARTWKYHFHDANTGGRGTDDI